MKFKTRQSWPVVLEIRAVDYLCAWERLLGEAASGDIVPLDLGAGEPDVFTL